MADGGQVECFVVMSACGEHRAIAQSRCLGLTGMDIHIYIHTNGTYRIPLLDIKYNPTHRWAIHKAYKSAKNLITHICT